MEKIQLVALTIRKIWKSLCHRQTTLSITLNVYVLGKLDINHDWHKQCKDERDREIGRERERES